MGWAFVKKISDEGGSIPVDSRYIKEITDTFFDPRRLIMLVREGLTKGIFGSTWPLRHGPERPWPGTKSYALIFGSNNTLKHINPTCHARNFWGNYIFVFKTMPIKRIYAVIEVEGFNFHHTHLAAGKSVSTAGMMQFSPFEQKPSLIYQEDECELKRPCFR